MIQFQPIYTPKDRPMRVAGFMSGSGTNIEQCINLERHLERELSSRGGSPFTVAALFSDKETSKARTIGREHGIPTIVLDYGSFRREYLIDHERAEKPEIRAAYDMKIVDLIAPYDIDFLALGGYMKIVTPQLLDRYSAVNVHPADLRIRDEEGRPKYRGDDAVEQALRAGEKELCSTTHIVRPEVDCGEILLVSDALPIELPVDWDPDNGELVKRVAKEHQERLKERGDWIVFPLTLQYLSQGRFFYSGKKTVSLTAN